jgi:hypothetical protein
VPKLEVPSPSLNSSKNAEQKRASAIATAIIVLGLLGLIFNVCAIFVGFHHTLYDFHGFRQTQTALTVDSLLQGGSFLRYETPVLGPPWAIPFEFPLYQGIVAEVVRLFGTRVEETGRAVSILFFYLCFFPLASILRLLRFRDIQIVLVLAIFAVSPLYIFWSRVFMIESTALFFSLMYVEQMFRMTLREPPWQYRHMIGAAMFGILGGLVKVTTFAPYFLLGVGLAAWHVWGLHRGRTIRLRRIAAAAFFTGLLPVAFTELWTKFADSVKAQNPLGVVLISTSKSILAWTFGTLGQRLQLHSYHVLESRIDSQIGFLIAGVLIAGINAGVQVAGGNSPFRRWNRAAATCVVLYAGTTMLFFNLHVIHEYYPYSTALFLVVAIGALIAPTLDLPGRKAWVGVALLAIEMVSCVGYYHWRYYPIQSFDSPGRPETAAILDQTTSAQGVILVTGLLWSPELPYQSRRRAIMDLGFFVDGDPQGLGVLRRAIQNVGPTGIAAVIACDTSRNSDRLKMLLQLSGTVNATEFHGDDCDIYEKVAGQVSPDRH